MASGIGTGEVLLSPCYDGNRWACRRFSLQHVYYDKMGTVGRWMKLPKPLHGYGYLGSLGTGS